jgi:S1-C subfamily serine protease
MSLLKFISFLFLITESLSFQMPLHPSLYRPRASSRIIMKSSMINRTDFSRVFIGYFIGLRLYEITNLKSDENKQIDIFKKTSKSVCFISTEYSKLASNLNMDIDNLPKGVGTGFLWDKKGHIVTNFHVINKVDNAMVILNNHTYNAKITGIEPEKDIAVLKIDLNETSSSINPITIGSIDDVIIGQYSYAIGNPFGQDNTFTMGIISGLNREITSPTGRKITGIIQTDTAINPGNSGGPLINSNGEVIGMNTASFGSGTSAGVNFAIPINIIKKVVNEIIEKGGVQKAIIGISYLDRLPSAFESKQMGINEIKKGVIVLSVPSNSSTGLRGIKRVGDKKVILGDIIIGIDNYDINNAEELLNTLERYKPYDKVQLKILRDGKEIIKEISLITYKTKTYTNMEIDIPLGNIAPQITPKMN